MSPRIYGWPGDYHGCSWYRIELPLQEMVRRGHQAQWHRNATGEYETAMDEAEVLIGQRVCDPRASARWKCYAFAKHPKYRSWMERHGMNDPALLRVWQRAQERPLKRLVFEVDDDLLNIDPSSPVAHRFFSNPLIRKHLADNLRAADTVVVTTEHLAEQMRAYNDDVRVVPNAIPSWLLEHERPRRDDGQVTIGWAGSATHAMDWATADDELVRVLAKTRGRADLHVIGGLPEQWSRIPLHRRRITGWLDDVPSYYRALDFDIGIAPLAEHVFNRSKSPVKALEYGALGIPVVATDAGPYSEYVQHGVTGYLVRRPGDWVKYLRELVHDADARAEMGAAGRRQAAEFTIERIGAQWEAVLTG